MRNKTNIQRSLTQIESINRSLVQFIRNTPMTESERAALDRMITDSDRLFNQIRTYLNQEEENFRG